MPTTDFLPSIGGVAQHIYELARAHTKAGHEVEVITVDLSPKWRQMVKKPYMEQLDGFRIWRVPQTFSTAIRFLSGQVSFRLSDARYCKALLCRLEKTRPDIVHWHAINSSHVPLDKWEGSPKVWTNHTSQFIEGIKTCKGLKHYKTEAFAADQIIAPSEELRDLTISIGYPADRVRFISNGVDGSRFHPTVDGGKWREQLGLSTGELLVLCPRRLEIKNGVRYFIEAALRLLDDKDCNAHFAVSGDFQGPKSASDVDFVANLLKSSPHSRRIHLLGRVENREMPGLYAASDLVVMPSLMEATSLSAMEAMATAKPIVSTNVGGLPFLVRDGENGILVPPRDPSAIVTATARLLGDPFLREQMGKSGRGRVEKELAWSKIADQTRRVYEQQH